MNTEAVKERFSDTFITLTQSAMKFEYLNEKE